MVASTPRILIGLVGLALLQVASAASIPSNKIFMPFLATADAKIWLGEAMPSDVNNLYIVGFGDYQPLLPADTPDPSSSSAESEESVPESIQPKAKAVVGIDAAIQTDDFESIRAEVQESENVAEASDPQAEEEEGEDDEPSTEKEEEEEEEVLSASDHIEWTGVLSKNGRQYRCKAGFCILETDKNGQERSRGYLTLVDDQDNVLLSTLPMDAEDQDEEEESNLVEGEIYLDETDTESEPDMDAESPAGRTSFQANSLEGEVHPSNQIPASIPVPNNQQTTASLDNLQKELTDYMEEIASSSENGSDIGRVLPQSMEFNDSNYSPTESVNRADGNNDETIPPVGTQGAWNNGRPLPCSPTLHSKTTAQDTSVSNSADNGKHVGFNSPVVTGFIPPRQVSESTKDSTSSVPVEQSQSPVEVTYFNEPDELLAEEEQLRGTNSYLDAEKTHVPNKVISDSASFVQDRGMASTDSHSMSVESFLQPFGSKQLKRTPTSFVQDRGTPATPDQDLSLEAFLQPLKNTASENDRPPVVEEKTEHSIQEQPLSVEAFLQPLKTTATENDRPLSVQDKTELSVQEQALPVESFLQPPKNTVAENDHSSFVEDKTELSTQGPPLPVEYIFQSPWNRETESVFVPSQQDMNEDFTPVNQDLPMQTSLNSHWTIPAPNVPVHSISLNQAATESISEVIPVNDSPNHAPYPSNQAPTIPPFANVEQFTGAYTMPVPVPSNANGPWIRPSPVSSQGTGYSFQDPHPNNMDRPSVNSHITNQLFYLQLPERRNDKEP
ncbi:hypothetical protein H4R33_000975 [Dimargaris cristalligena]|nr:hypothetical protein H4R33_000975 [Dimargaris cristalligena]